MITELKKRPGPSKGCRAIGGGEETSKDVGEFFLGTSMPSRDGADSLRHTSVALLPNITESHFVETGRTVKKINKVGKDTVVNELN
jgi:hypothetical protein